MPPSGGFQLIFQLLSNNVCNIVSLVSGQQKKYVKQVNTGLLMTQSCPLKPKKGPLWLMINLVWAASQAMYSEKLNCVHHITRYIDL